MCVAVFVDGAGEGEVDTRRGEECPRCLRCLASEAIADWIASDG